MTTIHASAVMVGVSGILIRGPSGSGKSTMSLELIDRARTLGRFGALIADDGVALTAAHGRLIARPPAAISGRIERRGLGILHVPYLPAGLIRLVIDLCTEIPRLPVAGETSASILGVDLPRLAVPSEATGFACGLIFDRLCGQALDDGEYLLNLDAVW